MIPRKLSFLLMLLSFVGLSAQTDFTPIVRTLPTRAQMPVANVNAVIQDSEGYMWYATYEGGLCRDNGYQIDVFRKDKEHTELLSDNIIYSLCEAPNGQIWFSTAHSVYVLDKHNYGIHKLYPDLADICAQHIEQLPNGNMLVAADTMVYEVSPNGNIISSRREKYRGRRLMVQPDTEGGFWICHAESNLCYALGDTAHVLASYNLAAKNILYDSCRHCLFAITREGLQVFFPDGPRLGNSVYNYQEVPGLGVYGLYTDSRRNLWMTGYQPSFTIFTPQKDSEMKHLNISSPQYSDVYVDYLVSLGPDRLGVFKDNDYYSVYDLSAHTEELLSCDTVTPPHTWKSDRLLTLINELTDIDTLLVKDATIDGKSHLWVVFDQFVREINTTNGRQRDVSTSRCGVEMNNFCCITAVSGGVCIGGAGGVCFMASSTLLDATDFDVTAGISSFDVTTDDGLTEKRFLYADGQLPTITVGHTCTCLTLYLTSFNPVNAPTVRFALKVEGLGGEWVTLATGENVFRLLNLPKGNYRIWLRATDENGLWGREHQVLTICREPAWWESWWAYTAYVLLAVAAVMGAFFLYRYVQERREQFNNMLRLLNSQTSGATRRQEETQDNNEHQQTITHEQKISAPELSSLNSDFSNKAIAIVKANMDDENYTVDMLADALCMSRVNLYRKMMTVCGQTPSDFIKTLRMEQAHHLLTTTDLPVNIVAGKCGFTSSSYFAKCFKARFGVLPTSVRSHHQ